ncbi:U-scoloptoxin(05)-Sm1a [Sitophilus oryzae]|uniref:U-scoloptoxin(05)-Sm1a n=1 Tax=Sitophilus oryzae TaxID=7048 RepID=A0A6J2YPJ8_SITOR|nr:U-scoloptoxin(05)-Sm1a [Sitophilus oryzae]
MIWKTIILIVASLLSLFDTSLALNCFQCNGSNPLRPFQCNEWLSSDIDIKPESCDKVYDAKYCIKHTGRFEGWCIKCYQCSGSENISCTDSVIHTDSIEPQSCDHVYDAQYCIKSTGLGGGIGTKRYCSSVDLGNYCQYVKNPGDILTYRSCVYTCTGDGCNTSSIRSSSLYLISVLTICVLIHKFFL